MLALEPPEATAVTFTSVLVETCWAITPPTAKYVPPSPPVENTRLLVILLASASAAASAEVSLEVSLVLPQATRLSAMISASTSAKNLFIVLLLYLIACFTV